MHTQAKKAGQLTKLEEMEAKDPVSPHWQRHCFDLFFFGSSDKLVDCAILSCNNSGVLL